MASHAMKITLERIALFQFTPAHCAQARAMLGWSVEELSRESRVSVDAIQRFRGVPGGAGCHAPGVGLSVRIGRVGVLPGVCARSGDECKRVDAESSGAGGFCDGGVRDI